MPEQGQENVAITIKGDHFDPQATVSLGSGVKFEIESGSSVKVLKLKVDIAFKAQPGPRSLTITNPDCSTATKAEAITITPKGER
jgi:hypothetical protein